jgi:ribosomal protein L29
VNEQTRVRTVQELADQLTRVEQMQADLRAQETLADPSSPSIHV